MPWIGTTGVALAVGSVSLVVERDLRKQANDPKNARKEALLITCHPEVAEMLIGPDGEDNGGKMDRQHPVTPGTDIGFRLWDVAKRRQPPPGPRDK